MCIRDSLRLLQEVDVFCLIQCSLPFTIYIYHLQEVDVLCLIQCSSPFIQPDFLESGYKLLLQVSIFFVIIIIVIIIIFSIIMVMSS